MPTLDRRFAEKFLAAIDDYEAYGVHELFNEWWATAPKDVIEKYAAAIETHPEQGPLAAQRWFAPPPNLDSLEKCAPGTLGAAYWRFILENKLSEQLAAGYRSMHEQFKGAKKLERMPGVLQYKVLRGYQTHDIHHVLTGYAPDPIGEISLQAFGLAQNNFPYAGMWMAVVTAHMTFINPDLIQPALDGISDGWRFGRAAKNIQLVRFEDEFDRPLQDIQAEFGLTRKRLQAA